MRIFYGWAVVAAAFTVMLLGFGVAYSFAAFFDPLATTFSGERADISLVFSICGLLYFMLGAIGGPAADALGTRRVIAIGVVMIGIGLIGAALAQALWQVYVFYGVVIGLGIGLSYVPSAGVVQRWFVRRRGLASGLAVAGIGAGTMGGAPFANLLIAQGDWRTTFLIFAVIVLVVGLYAARFLYHTPAERGLWPDGDPAPATPPQAGGDGWDLWPAVKSRAFVRFYFSALLTSLGLFIPFVHLAKYTTDLGLEPNDLGHWLGEDAIGLVTLIGLGSLLGRLFLGGIADRFGRYASMLAMYIGIAVMQCWWYFADSYETLAAFAVLFGICYGGFVALAPSLSADYFGTRKIGGIIGILYTGPGVGSFLGPYLAGVAYDLSQSYDAAIIAAAVTAAAGALLLAATPSPARWRLAVQPGDEGGAVRGRGEELRPGMPADPPPTAGNREPALSMPAAGNDGGVAVNQASELTVGIGGLGAIGLPVARALDRGEVPGLRLVAVAARDADKARRNLEGFRSPPALVALEQLAERADIVVECVPAALFDEIAVPAIERGRIFLPLSVGALLTREGLIERAGETGARIIVPTGALLGLDAVRAAAEGELHSVKMVTRKPPGGLKGAPFIEAAGIDLDEVTEPRRVFAGTARQAAKGFPANINVAAALSLAGMGPDRTMVEIWADPTVSRNTHSIIVEGDASRFVMTIEGVPSPENPATGKLTPLSTLATLRTLVSPMRVGT